MPVAHIPRFLGKENGVAQQHSNHLIHYCMQNLQRMTMRFDTPLQAVVCCSVSFAVIKSCSLLLLYIALDGLKRADTFFCTQAGSIKIRVSPHENKVACHLAEHSNPYVHVQAAESIPHVSELHVSLPETSSATRRLPSS
jgi:hypothetical protein